LDEIKGNMTKDMIEERMEKAKGQQPDGESTEAKGPTFEVTIEAEERPEAQEDPDTPEEKVEEEPGSKEGLVQKVGQKKDVQPSQLTQEERMEIFNSIDIYQAVTEDPELYAQISMRDAKVLCETKGLVSFDKDDFNEFGKFKYSSREKMGELMMSHPMFGKRVKELTQISLTQDEGPEDTKDPEN
jgi:hypothetical protein